MVYVVNLYNFIQENRDFWPIYTGLLNLDICIPAILYPGGILALVHHSCCPSSLETDPNDQEIKFDTHVGALDE